MSVDRHTEISTAAELRRRALALERTARVHDWHGQDRAADRQRAIATALRQMANLVEVHPFASENRGPAVLCRHIGEQVNPHWAEHRRREQEVAERWAA